MPYQLVLGETISDGLFRIIAEEIDSAAKTLQQSKASALDTAIHEARKSIKKIRAVIDLAKPALGQNYKKQRSQFRDIGRNLSELRDLAALEELAAALSKKFKDKSSLAVLRGFSKLKAAAAQDLDKATVIAKAVEDLLESRLAKKKWRLENSFNAIAPTLKETYRAGRRVFRQLGENSHFEAFHDLRKHAKAHLYHLRLFRESWDDAVQEREARFDELQERLGDEHNLALLSAWIQKRPIRFGGEASLIVFQRKASAYQQELRAEALALAAPLYAEKPRTALARLQSIWEVGQTKSLPKAV
jgi:CHAD domain-containing protein